MRNSEHRPKLAFQKLEEDIDSLLVDNFQKNNSLEELKPY